MLFRFNYISHYYKRTFNKNIQKISIDAGFTCPNRDGTKAVGGCTYCNNNAFVPSYCSAKKTIVQQIDEGIKFFSHKNTQTLFFAYFQAYSNTYAPLEVLKQKYEQALNHPQISGIIISTRPDCVDDHILDYIADLSKDYYVVLEYGVESFNNKTLEYINRHHSVEESFKAIEATAKRGIKIGIHLILGLPFDTKEDWLKNTKIISELPINFVKFHQLQIIKGTLMAKDFEKNSEKYNLFSTAEEYLDFMAIFISHLRPSLVIERISSQSPSELLIAPNWNRIKNYQLIHKLNNVMEAKQLWQGKNY